MNCQEYQRWFSPYIDSLLSVDERAQLDQHLSGCLDCRADLVSLQGMLKQLHTLSLPESPDLLPGIRRKLSARQQPQAGTLRAWLASVWPSFEPLHGVALAAVAVVIMVVVNLPSFAQRQKGASLPMLSKQFRQANQASRLDATTAADYDASEALPAAPSLGQQSADQRTLSYAAAIAPETRRSSSEGRSSSSSQTTYGIVAMKAKEHAEATSNESNASSSGQEERFIGNRTQSLAAAGMSAILDEGRYDGLKSDRSLDFHWLADDPASATALLKTWVEGTDGRLELSDERHVILSIPQSALSGFMAQFAASLRPISAPEAPEAFSVTDKPPVPTAPAQGPSSENRLTIRIEFVASDQPAS